MKRFFQRVKQHVMSIVNPVDDSVDDAPCNETVLAAVHYQPAADEPSFFTEIQGAVNQDWMAWYLKKNVNHGYVKMFLAIDDIKKQFMTEPPRQFPPGHLPDVLVGRPLLVSFNWVIWYKYEFNVSFEDAYREARLLTRA